ncbi:hypothetical protein QBC35DRAFT_249164 [Podospora australis]|uniref:Uncharacterized protein n=1 Tax=Podospora australis TaxID=1536484 RepID=A0AAN6WS04_9PEZI|nr:hypothetical protein QBC35DRAFT_249164 [Podospora australis]
MGSEGVPETTRGLFVTAPQSRAAKTYSRKGRANHSVSSLPALKPAVPSLRPRSSTAPQDCRITFGVTKKRWADVSKEVSVSRTQQPRADETEEHEPVDAGEEEEEEHDDSGDRFAEDEEGDQAHDAEVYDAYDDFSSDDPNPSMIAVQGTHVKPPQATVDSVEPEEESEDELAMQSAPATATPSEARRRPGPGRPPLTPASGLRRRPYLIFNQISSNRYKKLPTKQGSEKTHRSGTSATIDLGDGFSGKEAKPSGMVMLTRHGKPLHNPGQNFGPLDTTQTMTPLPKPKRRHREADLDEDNSFGATASKRKRMQKKPTPPTPQKQKPSLVDEQSAEPEPPRPQIRPLRSSQEKTLVNSSDALDKPDGHDGIVTDDGNPVPEPARAKEGINAQAHSTKQHSPQPDVTEAEEGDGNIISAFDASQAQPNLDAANNLPQNPPENGHAHEGADTEAADASAPDAPATDEIVLEDKEDMDLLVIPASDDLPKWPSREWEQRAKDLSSSSWETYMSDSPLLDQREQRAASVPRSSSLPIIVNEPSPRKRRANSDAAVQVSQGLFRRFRDFGNYPTQ